jgi:hypothetical protein
MMLSFATAQILDDSTKQVYSAKTTLYIQEADFKETPVDTSINHFHHYTATQRSRYLAQDLGIFGMPVRPLFYQTPTRIGTRLGIEPYMWYAFSSEEMRYFDTKSPFLQAKYIQGTAGDQSIDVLFTRSLKKQWNFAVHYARENANKQYGSTVQNDPIADMIRVAIPVRFESKKKKYMALFHFAHLNHQGYETGGARTGSGALNDTLFRQRFVRAVLAGTRSWQTQNTLYLYQHYRVDSAFTIFTRWKANWQRDTYTERDTSQAPFYPIYRYLAGKGHFFNFDAGSEGTWYDNYEQETGIKGTQKGFRYEAFVRSRRLTYRTSRDGDSTLLVQNNEFVRGEPIDFPAVKRNEVFLGGRLAYLTKKGYGVKLFGEYQLAGDIHLQGELVGKYFKISGKSMRYSPALVQERFLSNFNFWNNDFERTFANDFTGELDFAGKGWRLQPALRYVLLQNYIYIDSISPQQNSGFVQFLQPSLRFALQAGKWRLNSQTHYTIRTGEDILRQPALAGFAQIYCEDCFLSKRLQSQVGIEGHYKTAYFADGYAPYSKLFYIQNSVKINSYFAADVFFNLRIKNLRGFFKLGYASQLPNDGYLVAPVYPAMRRQFVFGFDWMFFD